MQHTVRFILDDKLVNLDFTEGGPYTPTTTVLNYLRSLPSHLGVKEGCAEGDCGACTVVVAEPGPGGKAVYSALDSCLLFLPMLHGKQLITVENLAGKGSGKLHPVQQAAVNHHGSQCGYCTPGIVMSMFALYKNHNEPGRRTVEDALTGNLCRCTGYRPLIDAAMQACQHHGRDHFTAGEAAVMHALDGIRKNQEPLAIITSRQRYLKPFTLGDALRLRSEFRSALIVNGATDIAVRQTKHREHFNEILDISAVEELRSFTDRNDSLVFGAGLTIEALREMTEHRLPALHNILTVFGSLQIRNLATLGGNIGSASPIGDLLPLLFACEAGVVLSSLKGERTLGIEEFITGYRKTALRDDELITRVIIPKFGETTHVAAWKVSKRRDLDISTVCGAFRMRIEQGVIAAAAIAYGGLDAVTRRAAATEQFLVGKEFSRANAEQAMRLLDGEFNPISDARSGAEYRSIVARNLLLRFFLDVMENKC